MQNNDQSNFIKSSSTNKEFQNQKRINSEGKELSNFKENSDKNYQRPNIP